ncbi:flagellar M-ring protein FliF [Candidatus Desantisbacteria bacterium]|nr:flagellar M-ring protein FliF [Candidatus Desantisbacteria bacterium]
MTNNMNFLNGFKAIWESMTLGLKAASTFIIIFVSVIFFILIFWAKQSEYEILFSGLPAEDASAIVEQLKNRKIPYKIAGGGSQILVPQDKVYENRLDLARQGLPTHGGVGFEIFDKNGLGMTDFAQKINYQRALQGELSRTIEQMEEVLSARVHIVLPHDSVFTEKEKPSTSSVILKLKHGKEVSSTQIQGIVHLVASSVEGLEPENITIVTTDGRVLSRPRSKDDIFSLGQNHLEYQRLVEIKLKNSIQSMLEEVLGPSKSVVRVTADIDFDKVERTSEQFDGENPVIRSEQRTTESEGVKQTGSANADEKNKEAVPGFKKNEVLNYEINKTVEHKVENAGKIKRLYVAAFIDGKTEYVKGKESEESAKYVSRTPEEMEEIRKIIMKAVGYDVSRGDEIEVVNMAFDNSYMKEQENIIDKEEKKFFWMSQAKNAGIAILGIVFLFFIFRSFSKNVKNMDMYLPDNLEQNSLAASGERGVGLISQKDMQNMQNTDELMNTISDFAKRSPDSASKLVAGWLAESKPRNRAR